MNFLQNLALKCSRVTMQKALKKNLKVGLLKGPQAKIAKEKSYMSYTHVPSCHIFCPYCSFRKYYHDEDLARDHFQSLRRELRIIKDKGFNFNAMYVGGGTTLINEGELLRTLELCKKPFDIREISRESDPNHIGPKKLTIFKGLIDRLNYGIQSFDDGALKEVVRCHKFGSSEVLQEEIVEASGTLPIFSIDLISNLPTQSKEQLLNGLNIAKKLLPQQITAYLLMRSNLIKDSIAKPLGMSFKDSEPEFYQIIYEFFEDCAQNNAWSFSLEKGKFDDECVNSHREYLGANSGAFSLLDGEPLINAFNLNTYTIPIKEKQDVNIAKAHFDPREGPRYVFLTEIFSGSLELTHFNRTLKYGLEREPFIKLKALKTCGAIKREGDILKSCESGKYLFMALMKDSYAGMDLVRAVFRDDVRLKNKNFTDAMRENVDPLNVQNIEFKA